MFKTLASTLTLGLLALALPAAAQTPVRTLSQSYFAGELSEVHVDVAIASLTVEGSDDRNVTVELTLDCSRSNQEKCLRNANRIQIQPRTSKGSLRISLLNAPTGRLAGIQATMVVKMPRRLALEVDLSGGDATISGLLGDVEVDSSAGTIDITYPQDQVAKVNVKFASGNGELLLRDGKVSASGWPRSIRWEGKGSAKIEVDGGANYVTVRLQ